MLNSKEIGSTGEKISTEYLLSKAYKILTVNFRYRRLGEIDIIAEKDGVIIFVEVKSRTGLSFGTPAESINKTKINRIRKIADYYLLNNTAYDKPIRFDVIEVYLGADSFLIGYKINHICNAF